SWRDGGRTLHLNLRKGVRFSDGSAFTAHDVAHTFERIMDPSIKSPLADAFRSGKGGVVAKVSGLYAVSLTFPATLPGLERLLDQVPILCRTSNHPEKAVLGPFVVQSQAAGTHVTLARNPNFWKKDAAGRALPYLSAIRLHVQSNRDLEALRFRRGELDMIRGLDPELFEQLKTSTRSTVLELGAGFDSEMIWFNQVQAAPIPPHRKAWFASQNFRKAVSVAVNRNDMVNLVFRGYAEAAAGPYTSANRAFHNPQVKADSLSLTEARRLLSSAGFHWQGSDLYDSSGNRVEFSIVTNAGNKIRQRMAAMIQQDLRAIGMKVNVVPLDFPSLIERITRTYAYEACLLGLVNVDSDPVGLMNVLMSSGANHQWNPKQLTPQTPWEAEIDKLMQAQAATVDMRKRRASFFRVQEILAEQVPFVYLVSHSGLAAAKPNLRGLAPAAMRPHLLWNVEHLRFEGGDVQ
ncbi:MAG TPA: ABC transporter substrate-binding protein, partial [Bryobacteraceae bacterium]|nr:ABC transporter substrate-binding protein [Bryobacteraceae bacterium]